MLRSLVLEAKINFETKLERDMNFGWIGGVDFGSKNHAKSDSKSVQKRGCRRCRFRNHFWYVCMYVCVYVCIYVCMHVCVEVYLPAAINSPKRTVVAFRKHRSVNPCVFGCACLRVGGSLRLHVCVYVLLHVDMYGCRYVRMYACEEVDCQEPETYRLLVSFWEFVARSRYVNG